MKSYYQRGFTLIETVMVIGLFTTLGLVIMYSVFSLYESNGYTIAQSQEIDHARVGLQNFLADAREMVYADDGTFPVAVVEDHRFGFYSDIDRDQSTEYTEYILATTTLYKYTYEATGTPPVYNMLTPSKVETLSEFVQNIGEATSTFRYFDTNGTQLVGTSTLLTDVRYIEAKIIVNINPLKSPGEFMLRGGVAPRNLKDNL